MKYAHWTQRSLLIGLLLSTPLGQGQSPTDDGSVEGAAPSPATASSISGRLSPTAEQAARQIEALGLIERLDRLGERQRCSTAALQALILREEITEKVLSASLQIDGFFAEIDSENTQIRATLDKLESRRDRAVNFNNVAGVVGGAGVGVVASALQFNSSTARAGNWAGLGSGAFSTFFSSLGFRLQRGWKGCFPEVQGPKAQCQGQKAPKAPRRNVEDAAQSDVEDPCEPESRPAGCSPRMLYCLFHPECTKEKAGFHSEFPKAIKLYLTGTPPRETKPRRERLIEQWNNPSEEKIALMTSSNSHPRRLSIDDLNDRAKMLADLRSRVSIMKRDLGTLTSDLTEALSCPDE